ncbi:hypothetical protein WR25_19633 [Diploscapter pachys]|uniref:C2H2-type domain-containing protein n=1 Tax=Diploscapter pachys TaxID=2018661 RepID=A0A2A2J5M4_9BILA|nr:hypothetical protein WR25_19633 [Diploscapter pachys]
MHSISATIAVPLKKQTAKMPIVYVKVKDERLTEFINILSQNQFGDYRVFRDLNDTEIPASWTFGSKDKKGRGNENGQEELPTAMTVQQIVDDMRNGGLIKVDPANSVKGRGLTNNFAIAALAKNNLASTSLGSDLRSEQHVLEAQSREDHPLAPMQDLQRGRIHRIPLRIGRIHFQYVNCAPKHKRNCMRSHATTRHMEIKRFKCSECEFATKAHSSMKTHFRLHEGADCKIIDLWNEDLEKQQADIARACFPHAFDCGARWDQFISNKRDSVSMIDM